MSGRFHRGVADPAGPPQPGDPAVEWVRDGVLLVRGAAARACDPSIVEAAARVAAGPVSAGREMAFEAGRTAVVLVPPIGQPAWRLARTVARYLPPDGHGIILVSGATAVPDNTGEVPAQVLADQLATEVLAPDGPVLAIPDGSLFVLRAGARAGWWRFRPGTVPAPIGPRYPVPAWQSLLAEARGEPATGLVLDQVPAGLWLHEAGVTDPGDLAYSAVADPWDLTLLVSRPEEPPVPVDSVAAVLSGLPAEVRARTVVSFRGPLSYTGGGMGGGAGGTPAPGWLLAARLGEPVRCNTGLPMMVGDVRQVAAVTAAGEPTWRPFAQQMRYLPAPETTPELVYWRDPAPRFAPGHNGMVALDRRWVVEVVEAGLWVRPAHRPVGGGLVRRLGADPQWCLVVLGDLGDNSAGLPWRLVAKVLRVLPPDARDRMRVALPYSASEAAARRATRACRELLYDRPVHKLEWDGTLAVWPTEAASAVSRATSAGEPGHGREPEEAWPPHQPARPSATPPAARAPGTPVVPEPPRPSGPPARAAEPPRSSGWPARAPESPQPAVPPAQALAPPLEPERPAPACPSTTAPPAHPSVPPPPSAPPSPRVQPAMPAVATAPDLGAAPMAVPWPAPPPAASASAPTIAPPAASAAVSSVAVSGAAPPAAQAVPGTAPTAVPGAARTAVPGADEPAVPPAPIRITAADLSRASSPAERATVRAALGWRYDAHAGVVNRMLAERPGLRFAYAQDGGDAVVTELVAVRAYLAEEPAALVETMRTGAPRVDLATVVCVASGLRRLAAHSGPVFGVLAAGDRRLALRTGDVFRECGFAVASPDARVALAGEVELVLWSATGRRLAGLGSSTDDDVVFPAGTRFMVLAAEPVPGDTAAGSPRTRVYGCELTAAHAGTAAERNDERIIARLRRTAAERDAVVPGSRLLVEPAGRLDWVIEAIAGEAGEAESP